MGSVDVSAVIDSLSAALARETDGSKVLLVEARAASIYWNLWKNVPVRFARRSPQRLGPNGRGQTDLWLTFGQRASLLTGKPHRATTPGNALLNYLYALLESEMTVALLAAGLDPGIGMFHADIDGRSSLSLDAIEAAPPCRLLAPRISRRFRLRQPRLYRAFGRRGSPDTSTQFPSRLHRGAMAKGSQPIAGWLAQSFFRAAGLRAVATVDDGLIQAQRTIPPKPLEQGWKLDPLTPPSQTLMGPGRGYRPMPLRGRRRDDPVPLMCWECGKALAGRRVRFCSHECATAFSAATHHSTAIDAGQPEGSKLPTRMDAKGARRSSGGRGVP
jgi:hypothetical protein